MSTRPEERGAVKAAFGARNRNRLIDSYFNAEAPGGVSPATAWGHVYRLLLWADQTTGLAHCYESDKSQPGKNWYGRALSFHDWVSKSLKSSPDELAKSIDWLFRNATADLAAEVLRKAQSVAVTATRQLAPYEGRKFPKPGDDTELIGIVREVLGSSLKDEPAGVRWQLLVQRVRQYLALENKRKNLVGEGFEDVLSHVVRRTCQDPRIEVFARRSLNELPGFNRAKRSEKPNKVDVAVVAPRMRTLVTAKWSVRADREKQFSTDFADYVSAESDGAPFEYVFVTNEFDPARLVRACEKLASNASMFTHVVHINTDAVKATYGATDEPTMKRVVDLIDERRLISLESWLKHLASR